MGLITPEFCTRNMHLIVHKEFNIWFIRRLCFFVAQLPSFAASRTRINLNNIFVSMHRVGALALHVLSFSRLLPSSIIYLSSFPPFQIYAPCNALTSQTQVSKMHTTNGFAATAVAVLILATVANSSPLDLGAGGVYRSPDAQEYFAARFGRGFFAQLANAFAATGANSKPIAVKKEPVATTVRHDARLLQFPTAHPTVAAPAAVQAAAAAPTVAAVTVRPPVYIERQIVFVPAGTASAVGNVQLVPAVVQVATPTAATATTATAATAVIPTAAASNTLYRESIPQQLPASVSHLSTPVALADIVVNVAENAV